MENNNTITAPTEGTQSEAQKVVKVAKAQSSSTTNRKVDPLWSVIRKAHKVFAVQIKKDNGTKLNCLKYAMYSKYDDHEKFWVEYHKKTSMLLDSRRFCNECLQKNYNPAIVAEHIVFEGSAVMRRVLKEGVINVLGESIRLYDKRFTPGDTARFVTEENDCVVEEVKNKLKEQESQSAESSDAPEAEEQQTPEAA